VDPPAQEWAVVVPEPESARPDRWAMAEPPAAWADRWVECRDRLSGNCSCLVTTGAESGFHGGIQRRQTTVADMWTDFAQNAASQGVELPDDLEMAFYAGANGMPLGVIGVLRDKPKAEILHKTFQDWSGECKSFAAAWNAASTN
jgi:hypothetical protein